MKRLTHPDTGQGENPSLPIYFSLAILSAALIAYELSLMQILSITQWHHFAYMVISVALLGFGAAGTLLSLFRQYILNRFMPLFPVLIILCAVSLPIIVYLSQLPGVRFDSYLLFVGQSHIPRLMLTYLLFALPFFLGALALGMAFTRFPQQIGKLYFANMLGSGLGGIGVIPLLSIFPAHELPGILALVTFSGGVMTISLRNRVHFSLSIGTAVLLVIILLNPPRLVYSQFKSISKTLLLPDAAIEMEQSSPYGLIQVVSSPALRYAPGLSLSYQQPLPAHRAVFLNGEWLGALLAYQDTSATQFLDYTTGALPYRMQPPRKVLLLNAGTGEGVVRAVTGGAGTVTVVEPNNALVYLLKGKLAPLTDSLLYHPALILHQQSARSFLLSDTTHYDLIELPMIGRFGGTVGLTALREQYYLTREAFRDIWGHLSPRGLFSVSCWMDYPLRNPLKLAATIAEMLEQQQVENPLKHVAAVRSWGVITYVIQKSPLTAGEIRKIRNFCQERYFDPALLPGITPAERTRFNQLQDEQFFTYLTEIFSPRREAFYRSYDFNIKPAIDERPYFSQFLRWKSLSRLKKLFGIRTLPFFEIGYLIVTLTLVQVTVLAFVLILLPLFRIGWKGGRKFNTFLYFSGIGIGYMFVEIVLIQRFVLYFGNPVYAAAAVLSAMLIFSGAGSYLSSRLTAASQYLFRITGAILVFILLYTLLLMPLLRFFITFPEIIKISIGLLLLAPLAFLMGFPFPLGILCVNREGTAQIPWAWGINGCFSVIGAVLATLVAVEAGFAAVMVFAAFAYGVAGLGMADLRKKE